MVRRLKYYGIALVIAATAIMAYVWYHNLPTPIKFSVKGSTPGPTRLAEDAKPDPLHIYIGGSAARLENVGKTVTAGIAITPHIVGEWRWVKDSQLTFTPAVDWEIGKDYTVTMDAALFPKHVILERYTYKFKSAPFTATMVSSEFYQDPVNPKIKKVLATVRFSHPVDRMSFEEKIHLRFGSEEYQFTVLYDKFMSEAYIHSNPISIPATDTMMRVTVEKNVASSRGGTPAPNELEAKIWVKSVYNMFRIRNIELTLVRNEKYEPEEVLVIETTDGVRESDIKKNLHVYELPKDRPAIPGKPAIRNYSWNTPADFTPDVKALSSKVELEQMPAQSEFPTLHSFKHKGAQGRYLYVKIDGGLESYGGYVLKDGYDVIERVPYFPKELQIMHDGAVLSLSGGKELSIMSRGLNALRFEVARVLPEDINHLMSQTSGEFKNPYFNNDDFNKDNIAELFHEVNVLGETAPGKAQYSSLNFSKYLKSDAGPKRGLFFVKVEGWDPNIKQAVGQTDSRFVLVTDLGVVVKDNADASHEAFVQSLFSGRPVAGAVIEVLGKNGLPVVTAHTDEQGHVKFPALKDFVREKEPVAYVIKAGSDISFLPYNRGDRRLNFSRFDTGGVRISGMAERLSAYLFSDRGIYRPGDTFHVGMVVKSNDWKGALEGIPLEAVITDSRGVTVKTEKFRLSPEGLDELSHTTEETSPTGNYTVNLYIIKDGQRKNLLGGTTVKIEEFLPDRMKITTRFSNERAEGWVSPEGLKGIVTLQNLFGIPAADRRIAATLTLSPAYPYFKAYKDYQFFDPFKAKRGFNERLKDQKTNAEGRAEFDLDLARFDQATYLLNFAAEGFEAEGGRGVVSESSMLISPLKFLIGYKQDGNLNYINKGSERAVNFIAIDKEMGKVSVGGLKAIVLEERYISVLTRQSNGVYKYESVRKEFPLSEKDVEIGAGGLRYVLPTKDPGNFAVVIKDGSGNEINRLAFTVIGKANLTRNLEKNAELDLKLNKKDYAPGEEIEISIKAPYIGAGLITVEGDKVYGFKWFKTGATSAVEKILVPAGLEGNGYVNVTFVRGIDSREIFMSPLSYGVAPFTINHAKRDMGVSINAPDAARPGEPFAIKYKSKKPGKIVVFAVDEGILQVAGYQTPNPLAYFFRKRALEVQTSQILDMLLPEFNIVNELSAPGGDGYEDEAIGKNLNPFKRKRLKPAIYWSGIIKSDTTEKTLIYDVPDYFNGTLRVMAVAVSADAVGAADKKSFIRGHFVISPNVPTFVAPGDKFEVSVGIANNIEGSGEKTDVTLTLATSKHIELSGGGTRTLAIAEGREKAATFTLLAKDELGSASLSFKASGGGKSSAYSVDISIRPPSPHMTMLETGYFKSGRVDVPVKRKMYPQFRGLDATASAVPLGLAKGLVGYLDKFPYGCTEQLVSKAFPAIALYGRPEFGYSVTDAEESLRHTISILRGRQNPDGGFGYWSAGSQVPPHLSVYALHYLTEAKEKGFPVPKDLLDNGLSYLQGISRDNAASLHEARTMAYAIYILTRNGTVTTNYITSLRKILDTDFKDKWEKDLTAVYLAGAYKLMKQDVEAEGLIGGIKMGEATEYDYSQYYDGLVRDAQYLYILSSHFQERLKKLPPDELLHIVEGIKEGRYNTISSSYIILALDAYSKTVTAAEFAKISIDEILKDGKMRTLKLKEGIFPGAEFSDKAEKIRLSGGAGGFYVFYQVSEAGFDITLPKDVLTKDIEVQREYRDEKGNAVTKTTLGAELEVHIKIRSVSGKDYSNVAVVDLLPGGFEAVLDSVRGNTGSSLWHPDYVDTREDRVLAFGSVGVSVSEFVYRIKATNKGVYSVPPVFAESMYDRKVQARSLGSSMVVEDGI